MATAEEMMHLRRDFLRYVGREMSDVEAQIFEERLLGDQEFSDAAAGCELDLIDDYCAGRVSGSEGAVLQRWIKASPQRLQRFRTAQALVAAGSRGPQRTWRMRALFPVAAMIAGLAVVLWMTERNSGRRGSPAPDALKGNNAQLTTGATKTRAAPVEQVILVVVERVRGVQQLPVIERNPVSALTLQVLLPVSAPNGLYHLQVTNLQDREDVVADENKLKPAAIGERLYLVVHLGEGALKSGSYQVSVTGNDGSYTSKITVR